jgi:hypothetical protein
MGRVIFDEPAWWQRPRRQIAIAVAAAIAAFAVWSLALKAEPPQAPTPHAPSAPLMAMRPAPSPIERVAPAPPAAASVPAPAARVAPSLSTMVAPGVYVTPLTVPPGTEPTPAGPREHDSEPEN